MIRLPRPFRRRTRPPRRRLVKVTPFIVCVLLLLLLAPSSGAALCQTAANRTGGPAFASIMKPASTTVASGLAASVSAQAPLWGPSRDVFTRWDSPVFTHSLTPHAYGTLTAESNKTAPKPDVGAEYVTGNSLFKNADVEFTVTGQQFAIRYLAVKDTAAMVWIDDQPVAAQPFDTPDSSAAGSFRWLTIRLDQPRTVKVRFAGPLVFSGVEHDALSPVTLGQSAQRYTLGVVGDSYYESTIGDGWKPSAAPVELASLTGFRVWNMAQGGTGYLNDSTGAKLKGKAGLPGHYASPYGSKERIAEIADAPIDALLVNGSINDGPPFTRLQHRKAVKDFLDAVHRVRPDLPIVLVGVEPVTFWYVPDVPLKHFLDLEQNLRCEMRTHPQVRGVVEPYRENWLTGSGSLGHLMRDGNQDRYIGKDWIHPTADGVAFYQRKVVAALRTISMGTK